MVVVDFSTNVEGRFGIRVSGHSGYGAHGSDPVCGAVSALLLTLLGGLETVLGVRVKGKLDSGVCDVTMEVPVAKRSMAAAVIEVFRYGFERLAEEYPDAVVMNNDLFERGCNDGA